MRGREGARRSKKTQSPPLFFSFRFFFFSCLLREGFVLTVSARLPPHHPLDLFEEKLALPPEFPLAVGAALAGAQGEGAHAFAGDEGAVAVGAALLRGGEALGVGGSAALGFAELFVEVGGFSAAGEAVGVFGGVGVGGGVGAGGGFGFRCGCGFGFGFGFGGGAGGVGGFFFFFF